MANENVETLLAGWPTAVLSQAARGEIDLNELAHHELCKRHKNAAGEDVTAELATQDYLNVWG